MYNTESLNQNKIYAQDENMDTVSSGTANEMNGYQWKVTEKGTYYTENGTTRVPNDVTFTSCGDSETGVTISTQGGEDDKATRHAKVTVTNDKTECGSITVSKTLLRNGVQNEKALANNKVKFRLFTNENATERAKDASGADVADIEVELNKSAADQTTAGVSWGTNVFANLPYEKIDNTATPATRTPITYYVFELDRSGVPMLSTKAEFSFDGGDPKEYVVAGKAGVYELGHGADTRDITVKYTNSLIEKGKIKVTKRIVDENDVAQTDATGTSRVGLFTLDDNKTPEDKTDDRFVLVKGRAYTVEVKSGGTGEVSFENLDFDLGEEGTTYYVFEVDAQNRPVIEGAEVAGYKVDYDGTKIVGIPTDTYVGQKFTLTAQNHDYDNVTKKVENGSATNNVLGGATIKNIATESEFQIVKVDRQSWLDASPKSVAKTLTGAKFEMKRIDETKAFNNDGVAYKEGFAAVEKQVDEHGVVKFEEVGTGYYEIKEMESPTGYLVVGDSTIYLKVSGGQVKFLQKEEGKQPDAWAEITPESYLVPDGSNLMSYAKAVEASGSNPAVPATVTVGNVAGPELPSTGGPGLYPLLFAGVLLALASALSLALDRGHRG